VTTARAEARELRWTEPAFAAALAALALGALALGLAVHGLAARAETGGRFAVPALATALLVLGAAAGVVRNRLRVHRRALERESFFATSVARLQGAEGFARALGTALGDVREFFRAGGVAVPVRQVATGRALLWAVPAGAPRGVPAQSVELEPAPAGEWLHDADAAAWDAERTAARGWSVLAIDGRGRIAKGHAIVAAPAVERLARRLGARRLTVVVFGHGREWEGRVVLVDPKDDSPREEFLRFVARLVAELGGVVQQRLLLGRIRARVGAMERARIARELHDGTIQSLVGLEMEVNVLRRRADEEGVPLAGDLARVQGLLRSEIVELRDTMQRLKPVEIAPEQLVGYLDAMVARFERDAGVRSIFDCAVEDVDLPARVCREIGRIVQEALQNVRKHSGAHNVLVRFGRAPSGWRLVVDDDGRGFAAFEGTLTDAQLGEGRKGPYVIRERVRSLGGKLSIESSPAGARLEILLPLEAR
jgi:signal transduction histidine kinase